MGNEAIAWGLYDAGVDVVSGYPGTPSSEILKSFQGINKSKNTDAYAEWAVNEKVGFEVAYAAAISRKRAAATMKQVGLNVASDALFSAAYIGNKGGFLLIVADDPGFYSSQTEQDSRMYAKLARIPVLDPSSPNEAYTFTKLGVALSEELETPVMLRSVMRVSHSREICEIEDDGFVQNRKNGEFVRDIKRWAAVPRDGRYAQAQEQLTRIEAIKELNWERFIAPKAKQLKNAHTLIIAGGMGYVYAMEAIGELGLDAEVLKIDMPYPLPSEKIKQLCKNYAKVLVLEETMPCIEEQIHFDGLHGKLDGSVHEIDEMTKERVLQACTKIGIYTGENIYSGKKYEGTLAKRPPNLCPGCPHRDIYYAITKTFRKKNSVYPSDIGCYTLGINQGAIDTVLCMGGSVSVASGVSLSDTEKTVVATIGDSTFIHGGIPPLINAVYQNHRFILVILDNSVTAMTGRQITPESNPKVDIKRIVEGCGAECMEYIYEPDIKKTLGFFKEVKKRFENCTSPLVVVAREFCVLDKDVSKERLPNLFATTEPDKCVACDICTTDYKCPPMHYGEDGRVHIDPFLCAGCGACISGLCPTDAFVLDTKRGQ